MSIRRSFRSCLVLSAGLGLLLAACKGDSDSAKKDTSAQRASPDAKDSAEETPEDVAGLPKAEKLLAKSVEAAGGKDKLSGVENFYLEGTVTILGQNIVGHTKTWWQNGDFYIEQEMPGVGKVRAGKSGDIIWSEDPIHGLRQVEGVEAEQHRWASTLMLPAQWKDHFESARTIAEREVQGRKLYDVALQSPSGGELVLVFSDETGLQVGQKFKQVSPMGPVPVEVEFSDYREVNGIKVPFKQVTNAGFAKVTQTVDELQVNDAKIDPKMFEMPTGGADVVDASKKPQ